MPAELLKPRDFDPSKRYPLILYVYGGPSAPTVADAWRSSLLFDNILAEHGYLVALVDNRVSTAISHELESLVLRKMSGEVERSDVLDAVAWLKDQPYVDPDRVGVWGWSGGGSFTLNLMTHSDAFRAGIAVAAVTDWRYYDTKWAEFAMKAPEDNPEGYDATSFVRRAGDLHGRLLLVHGTHDDNVHPQNVWAFVDALIEHNVPFELMIYPMRKHGISDRPATDSSVHNDARLLGAEPLTIALRSPLRRPDDPDRPAAEAAALVGPRPASEEIGTRRAPAGQYDGGTGGGRPAVPVRKGHRHQWPADCRGRGSSSSGGSSRTGPSPP